MLGAEVKIRLGVQQDGDWLVDRASRIKRVSSIALKLHRRPTMRLTQMQDVTGHRVVLGNQDAVNRVRDRLLESWEAEQVKIDDYVAQPRISGYRAIHVCPIEFGCRVEIQLRTVSQHLWATLVEEASNVSRVDFKGGEGSPEVLASGMRPMQLPRVNPRSRTCRPRKPAMHISRPSSPLRSFLPS